MRLMEPSMCCQILVPSLDQMSMRMALGQSQMQTRFAGGIFSDPLTLKMSHIGLCMAGLCHVDV